MTMSVPTADPEPFVRAFGADAPRVSVISPVYNAERFLEETISSVLAQDFADVELILVDDGSTDSSARIAAEACARAPNRVRLVTHEGQRNRGCPASRNRGVAFARGEFIAFIDSDDVWQPGKLSSQVRLLDAMPDVGMVCGTVRYWGSWEGAPDRMVTTGTRADSRLGPGEPSLRLYPLGIGDAPCPSDIMVRRALYERVGGFEESFNGPMTRFEDQGFFAKLYLETSVYFSGEHWTDYRQHEASCMAQTAETGTYLALSRQFLDWYEAQVSGSDFPGRRDLVTAIRRRRRWLAHPVLFRLYRRLRRFAA